MLNSKARRNSGLFFLFYNHMCLTLKNIKTIPKDGSIRYKYLDTCSGHLRSPFQGGKPWHIGKSKTKKTKSEKIDEQGFHVWMSLAAAKSDYVSYRECIVKCVCEGFIARGVDRDEIWRKITPIEVIVPCSCYEVIVLENKTLTKFKEIS